MKRICLGDKAYTVEFVSPEKVEGSCGKHLEPVEGFGGKIQLNKDITGHMLLDTMLHEAIHALADYLDEEEVKRLGTCLATALIQVGFVIEEDLCPDKLTASRAWYAG